MELTAAIEGLEGAEAALRRRSLHRLAIRPRRASPSWMRELEAPRLAHRRQQAGQERGSVARPRRGAQPAPGDVALGERPRRRPAQQPRRRARRRRHGALPEAARRRQAGLSAANRETAPSGRPLRNEFGAASRQLPALGPGSHSAFAACARESSGWSWRSVSQQRFPGRLQRSEAEWKGIRDPAQDSPKRRLLFLSQRSPPGRGGRARSPRAFPPRRRSSRCQRAGGAGRQGPALNFYRMPAHLAPRATGGNVVLAASSS